MGNGPSMGSGKQGGGIDRTKLRLAVLGMLVIGAFVALFSRLWFLEVLASPQYKDLAKQNRVRLVYSEPPRGRILMRDGSPLVDNRGSLSVTIDRSILSNPRRTNEVLHRLSRLLHVKVKDMKLQIRNSALSPYKPIPVATDVSERARRIIAEYHERFPGVEIEEIPLRHYHRGQTLAQVLGYTGEISPDELKQPYFKKASPPYAAGDIVGKAGVEREYDHVLRGKPKVTRVIVNSDGDVISRRVRQKQHAGSDLLLSIDPHIQKVVQTALESGIMTARRSGYQATAGAVVVMDPRNGQVLAMDSYPSYNPSMLADGISQKEWNRLTGGPHADSNVVRPFFNLAAQGGAPPGSTFKPITAGAALWSGVATPYSYFDCPSQVVYGNHVFHNFEPVNSGIMGFPVSLEVSCDTFYYELGWKMQQASGVSGYEGVSPETYEQWGRQRHIKLPGNVEKFQKYARMTGLGHPTGVDLPGEGSGRIPDQKWCHEAFLATKDEFSIPTCNYGWLPGYTVNMAIGQGDVLVTPLQMAVAYGAIANGGKVFSPRVGYEIARPSGGKEKPIKKIKAPVAGRLPLDQTELHVIQEGLGLVISGANGTAHSTFATFPVDKYPLAGKTGTAQLFGTDQNDAWFMSYGPTTNPRYVIAVEVQRAGFGAESAAPIARQIWEGIFHLDHDAHVGSLSSGGFG